MLEAEIAAANTNYTYYASPNKAALPVSTLRLPKMNRFTRVL